jgi:hypothetical protein
MGTSSALDRHNRDEIQMKTIRRVVALQFAEVRTIVAEAVLNRLVCPKVGSCSKNDHTSSLSAIEMWSVSASDANNNGFRRRMKQYG